MMMDSENWTFVHMGNLAPAQFKKEMQLKAKKKESRTSTQPAIAGVAPRSVPQPTVTPKWGKLKRMMKQAIMKSKKGEKS